LEQFACADTVLFDKTGTLTMGEPQVVHITPVCADYDAEKIINCAALVEKRSGHVLAKAIVPKAQEGGYEVPDPETFESITGHGVIATHQGHSYMVGNRHFIEAPEHGNVHIPQQALCTDMQQFHTPFYLVCDTTLCGRICVTDVIRPNAKETVDHLRRLGIKNTVLLSGDKKEVAQLVGKMLDITTVYGEVFPEDKLRVIKDLQAKGHVVAMVGDGINDAPALRQANVGIAMGAMGMEPAIQAADLVLMANDIHNVVFLRGLAQKTMRLIKQNIVLGLVVTHGIGIALTLYGVFTPIQAAFIHSVVDLFIVINAARLIGFRLPE
jgi:Cd2+/Zn2+-exporting ATPase